MDCPICKKLNILLVPVQFDWNGIKDEDRDKIQSGIKNAFSEDDDPREVIVTEADLNGFIHCLAYRDDKGNPLPVHQGHCTGRFPGQARCRYYIGDKRDSSSLCWCELEKKYAEMKRQRAKEERERRRLEREETIAYQ